MMKKILSYLEQLVNIKLIYKGIKKTSNDRYSLGFFASSKLNNSEEVNRIIYERIKSGKPFMAGRFGGHELAMLRVVEFKEERIYDACLEKLCSNAGFFPKDKSLLVKYRDEMIRFCTNCDMLGVWYQPFEGYFIKKYMSKQIQLTQLFNLEPWKNPQFPWSSALQGKKVLLIHPFENTIKKQYLRREKIYPNTNILPEFELKVLKAVQTAGNERDKRFENWFDALEYMTVEAKKIDFDIAIIGCGAYGAPLAARVKEMGKQAIHLGGATQLLFGIYGKRWLDDSRGVFDYVKVYINDAWVRPEDSERIAKAKEIEGGCYW